MGEASPSPAPARRWTDLRRRAASALVLAPIVLLCIWVGSAVFVALMVLVGAGLAAEWAALCGARPLAAPGVFVLALVVLAGVIAALGQPAPGLCLLIAGSTVVWARSHRPALALGVPYIGAAILALLWLRAGVSVSGRENVLFLVFVIWASDIGAYAVGRLLGGPKLAPAISPGKTWAGAAGGLLAAVLVGEVVAAAFAGGPSGAAALCAGLLGIACQAGDLLESGIKRHFRVKDSGRLIPGHGGLLDRLDGLLAAAPVAALVVLASRGGGLWE